MTHSPRTPSPSRFGLSKTTMLLLVCAAVASMLYLSPNAAAEKAVPLPAPSPDVLAGVAPATGPTETVVLAGGCFWGIQAVFQHTQGVLSAVSGYAGGRPHRRTMTRSAPAALAMPKRCRLFLTPKSSATPSYCRSTFQLRMIPLNLTGNTRTPAPSTVLRCFTRVVRKSWSPSVTSRNS